MNYSLTALVWWWYLLFCKYICIRIKFLFLDFLKVSDWRFLTILCMVQMGNKGAFIRFEAPDLKPSIVTFSAVVSRFLAFLRYLSFYVFFKYEVFNLYCDCWNGWGMIMKDHKLQKLIKLHILMLYYYPSVKIFRIFFVTNLNKRVNKYWIERIKIHKG